MTLPEFTCLCPKTGQPDFATFELEYVPDELCVELKSLKLYLWSFRDRGAFHEAVTNQIADDLAGPALRVFCGSRANSTSAAASTPRWWWKAVNQAGSRRKWWNCPDFASKMAPKCRRFHGAVHAKVGRYNPASCKPAPLLDSGLERPTMPTKRAAAKPAKPKKAEKPKLTAKKPAAKPVAAKASAKPAPAKAPVAAAKPAPKVRQRRHPRNPRRLPAPRRWHRQSAKRRRPNASSSPPPACRHPRPGIAASARAAPADEE